MGKLTLLDILCKFFPPKLGEAGVLPGSASDKPSFIKRFSLLKGGERIEDRGHYYERATYQHQQVRLRVYGFLFLDGEGEPSIFMINRVVLDQ